MKTIYKYIFLAICAVLVFALIKYQYDTINTLQSENNELRANWEKEKQGVLEASKRIKELDKVVADNQDSKRWADSPLDKSIADELYKQYLSNKD